MNKLTIIEGDINFIGNHATIHKVINIFTILKKDKDVFEKAIGNIEDRGTDYIIVEKYEGNIISLLN